MYLAYEAKLDASPGPKTVRYEIRIAKKYPAVVTNSAIPTAMWRARFCLPFNIAQIPKRIPQITVQCNGGREIEYDGFMGVLKKAFA